MTSNGQATPFSASRAGEQLSLPGFLGSERDQNTAKAGKAKANHSRTSIPALGASAAVDVQATLHSSVNHISLTSPLSQA